MTEPIGFFNHYAIDYGMGIAEFWTAERDPAKVLIDFHLKAWMCLGIRKSITQTPEIVKTIMGTKFPLWVPSGTAVALEHNPPIRKRSGLPVDAIAWNLKGEKIKGEWAQTLIEGGRDSNLDILLEMQTGQPASETVEISKCEECPYYRDPDPSPIFCAHPKGKEADIWSVPASCPLRGVSTILTVLR